MLLIDEVQREAVGLAALRSERVSRCEQREEIGVSGGVPEWSKGSDCKSDGLAFEGSNPSPSTI